MEINADIAIIGGGLAAYAAARELQGSGRQVMVIAKAPGASALNSGAWDIADSPLRAPGDPWETWPGWREGLKEILKREERHPYSVLARGLLGQDFGDFVEANVSRAAASLRLPMVSGSPLILAQEFGTVKPCAWAQASMADADLRRWDRAKVLVVGIPGYPNFNPRFIRQALLQRQEGQARTHVEFAGHLEIEIPAWERRVSLSAIELAQALDREPNFVAFGQEIVRYLEGKVYTHLLLPPLMGIENTTAILEALRRITGLAVAETLAVPLSVPGWRLQQALDGYLHAQGVEVLAGEVVGFDGEGRRVKSLYVHQGEQRHKLRVKSAILASGKYIGGGVARNLRWREPVFNLPVRSGGKILRAQTLPQETRSRVAEAQPFLAAGISINSFAQPLDQDGQVAFDNLFACGAVLGDFNPAQDRCAAGVSLISGTLAARFAAA